MLNHRIEVLKWDASRNGEGVDLYTTLGACDEDMPGLGAGHRVEYFIGLTPGQDGVASALAALGLYARRESVTIDHGHTVPGGGPLWPGAAMNTFLVLRQGAEQVVPNFGLPGGVHVEFLQVVPIYESERRFKSAHGVEELLLRWQESSVAFWKSDRPAEPAR